jgi:lantibiotic modifying enzyme
MDSSELEFCLEEEKKKCLKNLQNYYKKYGSEKIVKCIISGYRVYVENTNRIVVSVATQIQFKNKIDKSALDLATENKEEEIVTLIQGILDFASDYKEDHSAVSKYIQKVCWDDSVDASGDVGEPMGTDV